MTEGDVADGSGALGADEEPARPATPIVLEAEAEPQ